MISLLKVREIYNDDSLPTIRELIQEEPVENKETILQYLKNGEKDAIAAGYAKDYISGERIKGELACYSDGKYVWRSDTIYYFEKYNIKLPNDFIQHVNDKNSKIH